MSLSHLPTDLLGDCLAFLDLDDLRATEAACRRTRALVRSRQLWAALFERHSRLGDWTWPEREPRCGWKVFSFGYRKELRLLPTDVRNAISKRVVWRCPDVWAKLAETKSCWSSPTFQLGDNPNHEPLRWGITLQRNRRLDQDVLGVFLTQRDTTSGIRCLFSLGIVDDVLPSEKQVCGASYQRSVVEHYHITQLGGERRATCGFLFGVHEAPTLFRRRDVLISLDLTILDGCRSSVGLLYGLLTQPAPAKVKTGVMKELKRYSRQSLTSSAYYLQTYGNGPAPIIATLEESALDTDVHLTAASALCSILDTSEMRMDLGLVWRTVRVACNSICTILQQDTERRMALPPHAPPAPPGPNDVKREDALFTLMGVLWNIPVSEDLSRLINSCRGDIAVILFDILDRPHFGRVHLVCLHLLTAFLRHRQLPAFFVPKLRRAINQHIVAVATTPRHLLGGFLPSLRDVSDFFVPLLLCRDLECVSFGAFCISLMYF